MTIKPLIWQCLLLLICCLASGSGAKDDSRIPLWQPDPFIINMTNVIWGIETNHVKAGLAIQYSSRSTNGPIVGFYVVVYNNSDTNGNIAPVFKTKNGYVKQNILSLGIPPDGYRYTMALFDTNGNAVAKTELGKKLKPFDSQAKIDNYHGYGERDILPFTLDVLPFSSIVLEDYFVMTNAGKYHLRFVLNTFTGADKLGIIKPLCLPVNADIEIKKS